MIADAVEIEFTRLPEVKRLTGLSTATIYRMAKVGEFRPQANLDGSCGFAQDDMRSIPVLEVALMGGDRAKPAPGLKGECPLCGQAAQAKCGLIIRWHWAHAGRRHCDPWMENEGPWHRAWKAMFPFEWQEVVAHDATGEKHIADFKRPDGTVIELQNSPMGVEEMISREAFYGKRMIWIVNGEKFKDHIRINDSLPDPYHERMRDFKLGMPTYTKWSKHVRQLCHDGSAFGYFRKSDIAADPSQGAMYECITARRSKGSSLIRTEANMRGPGRIPEKCGFCPGALLFLT